MKVRVCELCKGEAAIYCPSDSAFLCWNCDAKVHDANFLVARHVRCTLCSKCDGHTDDRVSGAGGKPLRRICRSCYDLDSMSSSSSSTCISTAESSVTPKKKINCKAVSSCSVSELSYEHSNLTAKFPGHADPSKRKSRLRAPSRPPSRVQLKEAEGIMVSWCRKLGLTRVAGVAVPVAVKGVGVCSNGPTVLPFRLSVAASLWFGLSFCGDRSASTWQVLKRLEAISGVPSKLILAAESKLARVLTIRGPLSVSASSDQQQEEGWAESSV